MEYLIETKRLYIRKMNLDDFKSLKKVISDPINMKYYEKPYDDNGVLRWINWCMDSYKKYGFGLYAVIDKETMEMIGDCGISMQYIFDNYQPELGYHLRLDYHRLGLWYEMCTAMMEYFFSNFNYNELYSYMDIHNIPSEALAKKNGMTFINTHQDKNGNIDKVYRITKEEWLKNNCI